MKVYISNYRDHWLSPYTILEKVCFWEKDKDVFYNLEDKPNKTVEEEEILTIAYEALMIPPRDIHELANIIEANENFA